MFFFTRSRSWLRIKKSRSRSRPKQAGSKTVGPNNLHFIFSSFKKRKHYHSYINFNRKYVKKSLSLLNANQNIQLLLLQILNSKNGSTFLIHGKFLFLFSLLWCYGTLPSKKNNSATINRWHNIS